jgi:D-alanine-D-alanine ligase-like ATP-grasp enzyme
MGIGTRKSPAIWTSEGFSGSGIMSSLIKTDYCPHCYPSKNNHFQEKTDSVLNYYVGDPLAYLFTSILPRKLFQLIGGSITRTVIDLSQIFKHSEFTENINRSQFNNGILVIWDEAKRRGLEIYNIKFGNKHTQHFVLKLNGKKYYFDRNPIYLVTKKFHHFDEAIKYDDKSFLKSFLIRHNLPCPKGRSFISVKNALSYGVELGFPLVVKPTISSFSRHVSFNIQSVEELQNAIIIAKQINYKIVVERHIPGDVHRVTVIDNEVVGCTKRQASSIIGDGKMTIQKLINEKNSHPWRGNPGQIDCTLHKVEINDHLKKFLAKQNVQLNTKLKKGMQIFLSFKMNNGNGADVTNATAAIHPENEKLFLKVHKLLNLPLSGLDFICQDVSVPWQSQKFAIIENNSLPYIDAHHYPSIGDPINVASKIWDYVLSSLGD